MIESKTLRTAKALRRIDKINSFLVAFVLGACWCSALYWLAARLGTIEIMLLP